MATRLITAIDNLIISENVRSLCGGAPTYSFYADELELSEIASRISALDLFQMQTSYWIKEVRRLPATTKTERTLEQIIRITPKSTELIFSQEMHFDGDFLERVKFQNSKIFKLLKELVDDYKDIPFSITSLRRWVQQRALNNHGISLSESQLDRLIAACGELPALIDGELEKLALLKKRKEAQRIPDELFERCISKTIGNEFNRIRDLILRRDLKAIRLLFEIYKKEPIGAQLLRELYRNLELIYLIKSGEEPSTNEALKAISTFRRKFLLEVSQKWELSSVVKAKRLITDAEFRHRTGRTAGKDPIEAERNLLALLIKQLATA